MRLIIIISLSLALSGIRISSQVIQPTFLRYLNHPWVDSVMKSLTIEEKVGQLMWMAAFADRDISYDAELSEQIKKYGIGGIIFFQGNAREAG
ncbi:MAG: hypothetical protein MZV63_60545 [Marinilabiliales bacterium]|nr:hypothetical protein [Marinilabiliales bacterium]